MATAKTTRFLGIHCKRQKPTKQHRVAVFEACFGTLYAVNDAGIVKYFDYDWDGAFAYAGIDRHHGEDYRVYKRRRSDGHKSAGRDDVNPRVVHHIGPGKVALYIPKRKRGA